MKTLVSKITSNSSPGLGQMPPISAQISPFSSASVQPIIQLLALICHAVFFSQILLFLKSHSAQPLMSSYSQISNILSLLSFLLLFLIGKSNKNKRAVSFRKWLGAISLGMKHLIIIFCEPVYCVFAQTF